MKKFTCRVCFSDDHEVILDFGQVALADSFLTDIDDVSEEKKYQLTLVFCNQCSHVQIKEVLDPKVLFSNYVWETGIPASIKSYCIEFVDSIVERIGRVNQMSVLEIASNDGTMLKEFVSRGCRGLGVDPAKNIAEKANISGIKTIPDFFCERVAREIKVDYGKQDLIVARNVLAHVADLHGFIKGIKLLLAPNGTAVIEVPHLLTTFRDLQYDQVFHEHIGYHSLDSIMRLFQMYGLRVWDVETPWIHGGSLRAYVCNDNEHSKVRHSVSELLESERQSGILNSISWYEFADRVVTQRVLLRDELKKLKAAGKKVVGYGASGKGQCMIQYCGLDSDLISYIVDKSSNKIGKFTPGSHIPITSPDQLRAERIDVILLFAWNFADEIIRQQFELRENGVKFLHPIPKPHYIP